MIAVTLNPKMSKVTVKLKNPARMYLTSRSLVSRIIVFEKKPAKDNSTGLCCIIQEDLSLITDYENKQET